MRFHTCNPRTQPYDIGFYLAPDFRKYWASCHLKRKFRCCTVEKQAIREVEGSYWIYRNENAELPENACIKRMLDIDRISSSRRFYYGDLFIVRFTEHPKTSAYAVHDIPEESLVGLVSLGPHHMTALQAWLMRPITFELRLHTCTYTQQYTHT